MANFKVKTKSAFEHVYFVDAETEELAVELAFAHPFKQDFYQRHMSEVVIELSKVDSIDEETKQILEEGFW